MCGVGSPPLVREDGTQKASAPIEKGPHKGFLRGGGGRADNQGGVGWEKVAGAKPSHTRGCVCLRLAKKEKGDRHAYSLRHIKKKVRRRKEVSIGGEWVWQKGWVVVG